MFVFNSLGRKGNLGNQLFQIASTVGLAIKHNNEFSFPEWQYSSYFDYDLPKFDKKLILTQIVEKGYEFHEWKFGINHYDINGALQSEKYFDIPKTKEIFKFKEGFVKSLRAEYNYLFENKPIFISVRRGDFVNHPHYYQLTYSYYLLALENNFPDYRERNLIFMSDNIEYCKNYFGFLRNAFFLENLTAIDQLILGSQGEDYIISNSTFSWWLAWLGEKDCSKIIRPMRNFRGSFAKHNDEKDFFPERWISFDYKTHLKENKNWKLFIHEIYFQSKDYFFQKVRIGFELSNRLRNRISK